MKIEVSKCRISVEATNEFACIDVCQSPAQMTGYAACLKFTPELLGHFVLAKEKGDDKRVCLIMLPSRRWQQDLINNGYTILCEISQKGECVFL